MTTWQPSKRVRTIVITLLLAAEYLSYAVLVPVLMVWMFQNYRMEGAAAMGVPMLVLAMIVYRLARKARHDIALYMLIELIILTPLMFTIQVVAPGQYWTAAAAIVWAWAIATYFMLNIQDEILESPLPDPLDEWD